MAAAEYYATANGRPLHPQSFQPPQQSQQTLSPPYPLSDAPPPYTAYPEPRPHSQPPPQHRPPPVHDIYRPAPSQSQNFMPDKVPRPPIAMYKPGDFHSPYPPQQQGPAFPPPGQSAMSSVVHANRRPSSTPNHRPPQSPFREQSRPRSRSRSRHRKHHEHHDRPQVHRKKSSGLGTFVGAGGGALIGDAIFPGLGTLGGAILGGVGGHTYGKQRRSYSNDRPRHQRSHSTGLDYGYHEDDHRRGRKY